MSASTIKRHAATFNRAYAAYLDARAMHDAESAALVKQAQPAEMGHR